MGPKRKSDSYASSKRVKKLGKPTKVEEITFDRDARADYLTGFHKRKLARIKGAKDAALAIDKQAKVDARKQMRDQRKEELEELVEAGRLAAVRAARLASGKPMESEDESDGEEWTGVEDTPKPAPVPEVNHEEEYVDEDKFTLVTVEELDLNASDPESEDEEAVTARKAAEAAALLGPDGKEKKKWPKKEKKKKFRYLTKTERKTDRFKMKQKKSKVREKFKKEKE